MNANQDTIKKPVRTISGVTPLTVVLKPKKCEHGTCIYCPGGDDVPQSYTDKSPAIMRALTLKFDAYKQVKARLDALQKMGHPTDKIELIIIGGTFLQYPKNYQYNLIKKCFDALNGKNAKNLEQAKKWNEKAKHRCVAMCIENRPDNCSEKDIERILKFGCTRVEIGVQILDDEIYKKINRGHSVKDVINATKNLKNAGFKLGYHIMPGLPYSNPEKDLKLFKKIFDDENFRPDQLKIYPCQIVKGSRLEKIYKKISYTTYSEKQIKEVIKEIMKIIPEYCRVMRVMREIPEEKMATFPLKLDLRKDIEDEIRISGVKIKEIRMREVGFANFNASSKLGQIREIGFNKNLDRDIKLEIVKYRASDGDEYFLQLVNKDDILFGLLRLRIFDNNSFPTNSRPHSKFSATSKDSLLKSLTHPKNIGKAIVRELHVYGQALNLGVKDETASQHKGMGKWLMDEAEKIVKKNKIKKLAVISGVGVRGYYRKLGYKLQDTYMVKNMISF